MEQKKPTMKNYRSPYYRKIFRSIIEITKIIYEVETKIPIT